MWSRKIHVGEGHGQSWDLPEDIIQHFLLFLSTKEAAQMSLLSKSWYRAWYTCPVLRLDLDDKDCSRTPALRNPEKCHLSIKKIRQDLMDYASKSLRRYRFHNACIQQLHLSMSCFSSPDPSSFVDKLIDKIETARVVVKELRFSYTSHEEDEEAALLEFFPILRAEALAEFSVKGCKLKQPIPCEKKTRCCRLRRLSLEEVQMDEATLQSILSSCPLIENIHLINCSGLFEIKVVKNMFDSLKELVVSTGDDTGFVKVEAPSLESLSLFSLGWFDLMLLSCQHLKKLTLRGLTIHEDSSFQDLVNKFPNLEDLSVIRCHIDRRIRIINISSNSIKSMNLEFLPEALVQGLQIEINAPSMVSFEYEGDKIPHFNTLPATATSSIRCKYNIRLDDSIIPGTADWALQLREMLKKLPPNKSKVSLSFDCGNILHTESLQKHFPINSIEEPGVEVEDLTLSTYRTTSSSSLSTLIDNLFLICRPKSIFLQLEIFNDQQFVKLFCQRLIDRINSDKCNPGDNKVWENDLKDVKFEGLLKTKGQFVPLDSRKVVAPRSRYTRLGKLVLRLKW